MTATPDPREPGLWLRLAANNSEPWEETCPDCNGHGLDIRQDRTGDYDVYDTCKSCSPDGESRGTGTRRVRLVGWVDNVYADTELGEIYWSVRNYRRYGRTPEELIETIVEEYRAGTLPDEVAKWLHTEEVPE